MKKNNKNWSKADVDYLKESYSKLTINELVLRLERSEEAIRWQASQLGLTKPKNYWARHEIQFIVENISTLTIKEMAEKLGRTPTGVNKKVQLLKISRHPFMADDSALSALEKNIPFYKGKTGEYGFLLSKMNVGESFVYPTEDRQTIQNCILKLPDKIFRTRKEDEITRRVWRLF